MNKIRRKQIEKVIAMLEELTADIETLREEEQDYYDNMPESLQCGEKGEKAVDALDYFDEALSGIEDVISSLETASE